MNMVVDQKKKRRWLLKFVLFFFLITPILFTALILMENEVARNYRTVLRSVFETELIAVDIWPQSQKFDALYILGGNQRAQRYKFEVVSKSHNQKICQNIYFISNEDLTGYSASQARNLTYDEWSFLKMEKLGIPSSNVLALAMDKGMFGTMTEAENVAKLVSKNNYTSLILVAAPYHSQRVRLSFEHFLKNKKIKVIILGSGEPVYLKWLVLEWLKLKLYEAVFMMD